MHAVSTTIYYNTTISAGGHCSQICTCTCIEMNTAFFCMFMLFKNLESLVLQQSLEIFDLHLSLETLHVFAVFVYLKSDGDPAIAQRREIADTVTLTWVSLTMITVAAIVIAWPPRTLWPRITSSSREADPKNFWRSSTTTAPLRLSKCSWPSSARSPT